MLVKNIVLEFLLQNHLELHQSAWTGGNFVFFFCCPKVSEGSAALTNTCHLHYRSDGKPAGAVVVEIAFLFPVMTRLECVAALSLDVSPSPPVGTQEAAERDCDSAQHSGPHHANPHLPAEIISLIVTAKY